MSSGDTNIRVKVTASSAQIKQLFKEFGRLEKKLDKFSIVSKKAEKTIKKLENKLVTANKKIIKLSGSLKKSETALKKNTAGFTKMNKALEKGNKTNTKANKGTRTLGTSLGFTGLAFGFVGGAAALAANQIRQQFIRAVEDSAVILSEISRINVFSDADISTGENALLGFSNQLDRTITKAQQFGIPLADMATLLKDVEKAVPAGVDTDAFADVVAGFAILEKGVSVSQLSSDIATVQANFEELPIERIADLTFAFSKATKLSFSQGSKAIGFAAQAAKRLNTDLDALLGVMVALVNAVPGERGNAGRSVRRFVSGLLDPKVISGLENIGVEIFGLDDKFVGLDKVIGQVADIYNSLGDRDQISFIEDLGLTENALTGFLAFADKNATERKKLAEAFAVEPGAARTAVDIQLQQPEEALARLNNITSILKLQFTQGLAPALTEINNLFNEVFGDNGISNIMKDLGEAVGNTLVLGLKIVLPFLRIFADLLNENKVIMQLLGSGLVVLTAALAGLGIIFPILGAFFALIFLHEKLIRRAEQLGSKATLLTRAYARLSKVLARVRADFIKYIKQSRIAIAVTKTFNRVLKASISSMKFMGNQLKILGLRISLFSKAAFLSIASIGRAWIIALGPIAIAVGVFFAFLILMKVFQKQVTELVNQLDETGARSERVFDEIDAIFALLQGDTGPLENVIADMLLDSEIQVQSFKDTWLLLLQDLENSKAWALISSVLEDINTWFSEIQVSWDLLLASWQFNIDSNWQGFIDILGGIWQWFADLGLQIDLWLKSMGFDLDPVWADLAIMLGTLWTQFTTLIQPLTDFVTALGFDIPDPLEIVAGLIGSIQKAWEDLVKAVNENPLGAAVIELFGILANFQNNIDKGIKDNPIGTPREPSTPFINPEPGQTGGIGPIAIPSLDDFRGFSILEEIIGPQLEAQGPLLEAQNVVITDYNTNMKGIVTSVGDSVAIQEKTNVKLEQFTDRLDTNNGLTLVHNGFRNIGNALENRLNELYIILIPEIAKNINFTSAMTTLIANVNVMYARLIAEGNRAAGKLASLYVTSSGKFKIRDPGISAGDRQRIENAQSAANLTAGNQVFIDIDRLKGELEKITQSIANQINNNNNNVQINNTFNISEFENLTDDEIIQKINDFQTEALQGNLIAV